SPTVLRLRRTDPPEQMSILTARPTPGRWCFDPQRRALPLFRQFLPACRSPGILPWNGIFRTARGSGLTAILHLPSPAQPWLTGKARLQSPDCFPTLRQLEVRIAPHSINTLRAPVARGAIAIRPIRITSHFRRAVFRWRAVAATRFTCITPEHRQSTRAERCAPAT